MYKAGFEPISTAEGTIRVIERLAIRIFGSRDSQFEQHDPGGGGRGGRRVRERGAAAGD